MNSSDGVAQWSRRFARLLSALVLAVDVAVLAGYTFDRPDLIRLHATGATMSAVTALAMACLCGLVIRRSYGHRGDVFALIAAALAAATVGCNLLLGHDVLSAFVATRVFGRAPGGFGSMSYTTATCVILLSIASSAGSDRDQVHFKSLRISNLFCSVALVLSGLGVLEHLYDANLLLDVAPFEAMALPTALGLLVLSVATLAAQPAFGWAATIMSDRASGAATRRQLAFTFLPPIVGLLMVKAMAGGLLDANSAIALLVVLTVVPLALLVLRDGAVLDRLDDERKRSADHQIEMNRVLNVRLAEQAEQLQVQAEERLTAEAALHKSQRLEAVGQLTGGIAHDFNNLLMAVKGNLDLMRRRLPDGHPAIRFVDNAQAATAKGTRVTQQLLAFSRTQRLEIRSVDVAARLAESVDLIARAVGPQWSVTLSCDADEAWAATDPDQLELAVLNLAINSRDAMPHGGRIDIALAVRSRAAPSPGGPPDDVVVSVSDTGEGMSPDVVARATEPFFTTKAQGKGTGLGLAQAYGFAKQCDGDLRIRSAVGEGTTIEIWLRRVPAEAASRKTVAAGRFPVLSAARSRKVLVVDDDDAVRNTIVIALREGGQTVAEASNGASGLETLGGFEPDVAVVDFIMPGMNGADMARAAQRHRPGLPIVFVSGYSDTLALDGIANAVVLRKPFEFNALFSAIETLVPN